MDAVRLHVLVPTLLVVGVLAYAFHLAANESRVRVTLEGSQFPFAPATIRLRVRVEPDAANRALTVALVSQGYETSSLEALDGLDAPITRWVEYHGVPAGAYAAEAVVHRPSADAWRTVTYLEVR